MYDERDGIYNVKEVSPKYRYHVCNKYLNRYTNRLNRYITLNVIYIYIYIFNVY